MAFSRDSALQYLQRAHKQNRLAHAYLISGPVGSGKSTVAALFAAALNKTTPEEVLKGQAPDIFITEPASRSRRIVIEQIRNLERALQLRTSDNRRKIGIVRDADRMQSQAANAFLKTLEEPPQNSLLLLLTTLPEALPETILSRCLSMALEIPSAVERSPEEKKLLRSLCAISDEKRSGIESAYYVSQAIQRLLDSIREGIKTEHAEALRGEEARYRNTTDGAWLAEREDYYKALSESMYRERRSRLIEMLFLWWVDVLRAKVGATDRHLVECEKATTKIAQRMTTADALKRIRRLEELRDHLNTTAQEALVLEVACLSVFR
jgi:DNA polymerase-3 subunit delta'